MESDLGRFNLWLGVKEIWNMWQRTEITDTDDSLGSSGTIKDHGSFYQPFRLQSFMRDCSWPPPRRTSDGAPRLGRSTSGWCKGHAVTHTALCLVPHLLGPLDFGHGRQYLCVLRTSHLNHLESSFSCSALGLFQKPQKEAHSIQR